MISKFVLALSLFSLMATTACGSNDSFRLWDVSEQTEIPLSEAAGDFPRGGIVVVGEQHAVKAHHDGQVAVIKFRWSGMDNGQPGFPLAGAEQAIWNRHHNQ